MLFVFNRIVIPDDALRWHGEIGVDHKIAINHCYADTLPCGSHVGVKSDRKRKNGLGRKGADRFGVLHVSAKLGC